MDTTNEKDFDSKEYAVDSGSDREKGDGAVLEQPAGQGLLHQKLQGRHMQMIAIGKCFRGRKISFLQF